MVADYLPLTLAQGAEKLITVRDAVVTGRGTRTQPDQCGYQAVWPALATLDLYRLYHISAWYSRTGHYAAALFWRRNVGKWFSWSAGVGAGSLQYFCFRRAGNRHCIWCVLHRNLPWPFQTVDRGQLEAAVAYGMRPGQVFRRIMLPQMLSFAIPGINNNWLGLVKPLP